MKKALLVLPILVAAIFLSGCGTSTTKTTTTTTTKPTAAPSLMTTATVIRSDDGGTTWNQKIKVDDKKTIAGIDVLSMAINPNNPSIVYIGTEANGLFVTKDNGETWKQVAFANKVYGLVFDPQNPDIMYGSGIFEKRAKIYKRIQEDQEWKEIYTEPAEGTTISNLAIDKTNPRILYAGTSEGVIIKTTDGGSTWVNLKKAEGPVVSIAFDAVNSAHIFFGVFQKSVLETKDGGTTIEDVTKKIDPIKNTTTIYAVIADPYLPGVIYAGTENGIFRRSADETWNALNIIESSKVFPMRAISINPKNSQEIIYSSAKAIYKSVDGGVTWSTFQLDTAKEISTLRYDPIDSAKIYAGLRKF